MKKRRIGLSVASLSLLFGGFTATSCTVNAGQVNVKVASIAVSEQKTTYHVNETFTRPKVTATYSNGLTKDVTLEAKFSGYNLNKAGTYTVVVTFSDVTTSYQITVVNEVKEIEVSGETTYFEVGDTFAFGGVVKAVYDDESKVDVTSSATFSGYNMSQTGTQTVTVTYQSFTATYEINVTDASTASVVSISIDKENAKTEYNVGDEFVKPTVTAKLSDESSKDVTNFASFSGYNMEVAGNYTVTVSYKGISDTYDIVVGEPSADIGDDDITGSFSITTSDGTVTQDGNKYTISAAGSYKVTGKLEEGQIYVNAPDGDVEIELAGTSISCSTDSPIFIYAANGVDIKVKKNTKNFIYDTRMIYTEDDTIEDSNGEGAIFAEDGDLKIKGTGALEVTSYSTDGIHGKDDVTIKNATLAVYASTHGIKGNDSVTIEETPTISIECGGDGIKTKNTDVSSKGNQRGNIEIVGGDITINSMGDGIDAAYSAIISNTVTTDDDGNESVITPVIDIYTNIYSTYYAKVQASKTRGTGGGWGPGGGGSFSEKAADSAKGIKACQVIDISGGVISTKTYDDGIHGNQTSDDVLIEFDNGESAIGDVSISGGELTIDASDDGIHADGALNISGGTINVTDSHEGLEGETISISGGISYVNGNDDGVNGKSSITVSGGYLDVTVSNSGDVDGIDSNGTYTQTGGTVVVRGPASGGAWSLDSDGSVTLNGGTIIVVGGIEASSSSGGGGGWGRPGPGGGASLTVGSNMNKYSSSSYGLSKGSHTVTIGSTVISYNNSYSYSGSVTVYSDISSSISVK